MFSLFVTRKFKFLHIKISSISETEPNLSWTLSFENYLYDTVASSYWAFHSVYLLFNYCRHEYYK